MHVTMKMSGLSCAGHQALCFLFIKRFVFIVIMLCLSRRSFLRSPGHRHLPDMDSTRAEGSESTTTTRWPTGSAASKGQGAAVKLAL